MTSTVQAKCQQEAGSDFGLRLMLLVSALEAISVVAPVWVSAIAFVWVAVPAAAWAWRLGDGFAARPAAVPAEYIAVAVASSEAAA